MDAHRVKKEVRQKYTDTLRVILKPFGVKDKDINCGVRITHNTQQKMWETRQRLDLAHWVPDFSCRVAIVRNLVTAFTYVDARKDGFSTIGILDRVKDSDSAEGPTEDLPEDYDELLW